MSLIAGISSSIALVDVDTAVSCVFVHRWALAGSEFNTRSTGELAYEARFAQTTCLTLGNIVIACWWKVVKLRETINDALFVSTFIFNFVVTAGRRLARGTNDSETNETTRTVASITSVNIFTSSSRFIVTISGLSFALVNINALSVNVFESVSADAFVASNSILANIWPSAVVFHGGALVDISADVVLAYVAFSAMALVRAISIDAIALSVTVVDVETAFVNINTIVLEESVVDEGVSIVASALV